MAHDERLGLGEAALAAGDDEDQADGAEEGEAGGAIHRGCDQEIDYKGRSILIFTVNVSTVIGARMSYRKWRENKQHLI